MSVRERARGWILEIMTKRVDFLVKLDGLYDEAILLKNTINQFSSQEFEMSAEEKKDAVALMNRNLDALALLIDGILDDHWEQALLHPLI
jgi:hypothetical protein